MNLLNISHIDNHPLVQCINNTDILCNLNKKILYKELKISPLYHFKNILNKNINLPSQENYIKELFEKVLPHNEKGVNNLIKEYKTIKDKTSCFL